MSGDTITCPCGATVTTDNPFISHAFLDQHKDHQAPVKDKTPRMYGDTKASDPCILVVGNLSDGFRFIGSFASFDDAAGYSEWIGADTWVATLETPET